MLKAMFNEIQSRLGRNYGLFQEFNAQVFKNEEFLAQYKNIGVLYINNGNLGKLPNAALMEISYTLELFMRVDDTFVTSDMITDDLVDLATGTTGQILTDGVATQFVLDTGLPTSDGAIIEGLGDHNYIRYEVPINVVFTQGVELADTGNITLTINGNTITLQSVLSVTEVPQTQVETASFLDAIQQDGLTFPAMQNESAVIAFSWSLQIVKLYRPTEDAAIRQAILESPRTPVTVTYKGKAHKVIFHDCVFANELGQASVMTINLSTAMRTV